MTGAKVFTKGDHPPELSGGEILVVHFGDYRRQEVWVASGANIGNIYPLGGEFGRPEVVEDPRPHWEQMTSREPWRRPPGTIPLHPTWDDVVARGPVTLMVAATDEAYAAGWEAGRDRLLEQIEQLRDDEDVPPGHGWRVHEAKD